MNGKALLATKKFLEAKDFEVLDVDLDNMMIVAKEKDELTFVEVEITEGEDFTEGSDRSKFEKYMVRWMLEHRPVDDCHIRFDKVSMVKVDNDHAALRHHINCFS